MTADEVCGDLVDLLSDSLCRLGLPEFFAPAIANDLIGSKFLPDGEQPLTGAVDCLPPLFVPGDAAPQGSKRHVGNGRMIESSKKVGPWRERVALAAHAHGFEMQTGATRVELVFVRPRTLATPKSRTPPAIKKPDLDKLERAILDALTGIAYADDSLVTDIRARKRLAQIGETPGVHIIVSEDREA